MPEQTDSIAAGRRTAPRRLVLVRHGQSLGNVADAEARKAGEGRLAIDFRDADTPLSDLGTEQATALGAHLASLPEELRPEVILSSPYARARGTAETALQKAGLDHSLVLDERLRERDLGIFDGLTGDGIRAEYPEEAERRTKVGKFYYRPPGGESWCDVALRVRSVLADIRQEYADEHVWIFSHQAVIMSFRLVLEGLDEVRQSVGHAKVALSAVLVPPRWSAPGSAPGPASGSLPPPPAWVRPGMSGAASRAAR